ncbi:hypothetical protein ABTZ93_05720 [Streptomyces sp. NPDC097941]|uniref:hypothetical protein n=1 Tax=Streptomyces sp. NPDC097941 TaxID=3155685 RepID=UPI00331FAA01
MTVRLGRAEARRLAHRRHRILRRLGPCLDGDCCPAAFLLDTNDVAVMGTALSEENRKKHSLPDPEPHHTYVVVPSSVIREAKKALDE